MPSVENHVRFCVQAFGEENRELCYMINSWIDAPSRELGGDHRVTRHDIGFTPHEACEIYGDGGTSPTPRNLLVVKMVLQHLRLDGIITPSQEKRWSWEETIKKMERSPEVSNRFFNYILPSRKVILHKPEIQYRSNNVIFKNIAIFDPGEQNVYWRRVISHIASRAKKKYGEENVNARMSENGDLQSLILWGLKPVLMNIWFCDNTTFQNVDRETITMFFTRTRNIFTHKCERSNGYILSLIALYRFFSIPRGFQNAIDGTLVKSPISPNDTGILKRLIGKESFRVVRRLIATKDKDPELRDLVIFVGKEFSGLVSLPLSRKDFFEKRP